MTSVNKRRLSPTSMNGYDTFTPNIPDTEESSPIEILTPAPEKTPMPEQKKEPKQKVKTSNVKKQAKAPSKPVGQSISESVSSIKSWAHSQTVRWITGLFIGFFGVYLGISFLSYFSACMADQSEIANTSIGVSEGIVNSGGEGGARISQFLINDCFGLGSFVIIFWMLAMSLKLLAGKPNFKSVDFTIKSLVALITVSLIVGLLTIGLHSPVNWGGYHGRFVNEFVIRFLGWTGAGILCLFMIGVFVVICMRDLINWIIRIRKQRSEERKRIAAIKAEELAQKMELEKMRKAEEAAAAVEIASQKQNDEEPDQQEMGVIEESEAQVVPVTFSDDDSGYYYELPDFDEVEDSPVNDMQQPEQNFQAVSSVENPNQATDETPISDGTPGQQEQEPNDSRESAAESIAEAGEEMVAEEEAMVVNVNEIAQTKAKREASEMMMPGMHPYKFPPSELLREGSERVTVDADEQMANKEKIKKTLLDFGIPIVSIEATVGPTVTLYKIVPERGVKINRIRNLVDDIALRISAVGVRIIAPIPGEGTVGIEVANNDPQTVSMRTIINSLKYQESKAKLPIAIGSTISNDVYITDLAKMPHLLVAGATGQGKSVGLNAIIASLLYRKTPDELKFVMIDPKMVEFSLYARIEAHYLAKIPDAEDAIITDMDKVVATLSSLCVEMDDRYQLLKAAHTRNIEEYNEKIKERQLNPAEGHRFLPYIVVIVDEFSDLIMTAGKEVEIPIARLAQKARAVGMHVIIATQRPSTNVITGIIKANFPARIAFKVSSGVDSKTILDTPGAQQLIGRGDMLISNNAPMVRVQCAFIDTPEVEAICDYIERQPYGQGAYILPEPPAAANADGDIDGGGPIGDRDPLFEEVARTIITSNTASTSSIQRRYSIGYNRAGKIMDQLEAAGIVGPAHGGKPRSVLVDPTTLESIINPE